MQLCYTVIVCSNSHEKSNLRIFAKNFSIKWLRTDKKAPNISVEGLIEKLLLLLVFYMANTNQFQIQVFHQSLYLRSL